MPYLNAAIVKEGGKIGIDASSIEKLTGTMSAINKSILRAEREDRKLERERQKQESMDTEIADEILDEFLEEDFEE